MRTAVVALLLLCGGVAFAQKRVPTPPPGTTLLRFNPLGLIDPMDLNFSIGAERVLRPKLSVASDFALVFNSTRYQQAHSTSGFIFRPAVRYYPNGTTFFIEGELHYKQVNHRIRDWLGMEEVNGIPSYETFRDFTYRRRMQGFHFKVGKIIPSFLGSNFWWEIYVGLGVRHFKYKVAREPRSVYQRAAWLDGINEDRHYATVLPAGMRVMWPLRGQVNNK